MFNFWSWLANLSKEGRAKVELELNGIVYDKDFVYNEKTDILTVESSQNTNQSMGSTGKILETLKNKNFNAFSLKITFK